MRANEEFSIINFQFSILFRTFALTMLQFADVILPLPLQGAFTYALPPEPAAQPQVGSRVIVPFGSRKFYTAIVVRLHDETPPYSTKSISLKSADVTVEMDAADRLTGLKGSVSLNLFFMIPRYGRPESNPEDGTDCLDVSFDIAIGNYGDSRVEAFDPAAYGISLPR